MKDPKALGLEPGFRGPQQLSPFLQLSPYSGTLTQVSGDGSRPHKPQESSGNVGMST